MSLRKDSAAVEMAAFDALPPEARRALAECPFAMSAAGALPGYLMGYPGSAIVRKVEAAAEGLAERMATAPGTRRPGDALQLYPRRRARKVWGRDPL